MRAIQPCLWFDDQAEEAAEFYVATFGEGRIVRVDRYGPAGPGPEGQAMLVTFELFGQTYQGLNGGPQFRFTEAVSFVVPCESQEEVDRYWDALVDGGEPSACGWLKDRFGLSWQVVPTELDEMMRDPDPVKVERVTRAMLATWGKLDLVPLRAAFEGR